MEDETRIPLVEEEARVEVEERLAATVRVSTRTELSEDWVKADLKRSDVQVKTVPVGREIERPPEIRVEGETTIIPVLEEIIVVEKRLWLKEELHVTRREVVETVEEPVVLRRQHVTVERFEETKENET